MTEEARTRAINWLEEAGTRVCHCEWANIPAKFKRRATTINNKIVDLMLDIRETPTKGK